MCLPLCSLCQFLNIPCTVFLSLSLVVLVHITVNSNRVSVGIHVCCCMCCPHSGTRYSFFISLPSSHPSNLICVPHPFLSLSLSSPLPFLHCLSFLVVSWVALLPSQHRFSPLFFFSLFFLFSLSLLFSPLLSNTAPAPWQHTRLYLYLAGCSPDPLSPFLYSDLFIPVASQTNQSARCQHHTCPKLAAEMPWVGQDSFETVCFLA